MGKGSELIFFQTGDVDGQQKHEKVPNIANHQENTNQNRNEKLLHTGQNGYHQKEHR